MRNAFEKFVVNKWISLKKGVHFVYLQLIAPSSLDEDTRRKEFILNIILLASLILLTIFFSIVIINRIQYGAEYQGIPVPLFTAIYFSFLFIHFLSRQGKYVFSAHALIILYFLGATYGAIHFGADLHQVLLTYILIIIISSILIDSQYGFFVTIAISLTVSIVWQLQLQNVIIPSWHWKAIPSPSYATEVTVMFALIMTLSWLYNREIEKSLHRARASEKALTEERDQLEIKVEERTKDLKQAQAEKITRLYRFAEFGKLSSGLFHDLMSPLNAVIMSVDQMDSSAKEKTEVHAHLDQAVQASRKMGDFLQMIRKQIQSEDVHEVFSLNKEIEETIELLGYRARVHHVSIGSSMDEHVETCGNRLKFHQIALNLISNAIDASEANEPEDKQIEVILEKRNGNAVFTVRDKGVGMSPEIAAKIFDPFFSTKSPSKGMGLGLSTTKTIIEKDFSGTVAISSTEGKGSAFQIVIPIITPCPPPQT